MSNYLSKRGYVIRKDSMDQEEITKLKLELYAKPLVDTKFSFPGQPSANYPVYIETKNKLYIPKMFGINKYGFPNSVLENYEGQPWSDNITFNGSLLDRQIGPVNLLIKSCEEIGGGILSLETGLGKTVSSLYALSKLKGKAIILVNKIPLMNQWKSEIAQFLPNAKVGIIQGKNVPLEDCDIVIAMLQSMARTDYPDSLFTDYKVVIIDEIQNYSSKVFSQVLFKVCCKYTIGLSATPKRSDGCEYVFKWHIGDIVYQSHEVRKGKPPIIRLLKIDTEEYKEVSIDNRFTGQKQIQFTSMLSELVEMPKRNLLVVECIKDFIKLDQTRKILVLSDRRTHLQNLESLLNLDLSVTFTYGLFLGNMKQKTLEESRASQVILATFAAFSEGVSEKDLDTLILITPKKFVGHLKNSVKNDSGKLEQTVGRIFRKDHLDKNPIILDFQDNFSVYKTQAKSRNVFYKQHFENAVFQDLSINLDENETVNSSFIKIKTKTKKQKDKEEDKLLTNDITQFCIID